MVKEYHKKHPTISFRCRSIDEYNNFKKMVENSGKSESDFVREVVLNAEIKESKSYSKGYSDGFNKFAVQCPFCGEPMIFDAVNNAETNQKINEVFGTYVHDKCIEAQKKQKEA